MEEEEIIIIEEDDEEEFVIIEEDIEYIAPTTQEKIIMPNREQQIVVPDEGVFALSKVTVGAVTNEIDENIKPSNIKLGVSILGVEGNVEPDKPDQAKEVSPTKEVQTITADTGYELASVTVNAIPNDYVEVNGTLDITNNGEYDVKSYEKANVNVGGLEITNANYLFYDNARVDAINELCALVSSNCQYFNNTFSGVTKATILPPINTSGGTTFSNTFQGSSFIEIPLLDGGNITTLSGTFRFCTKLQRFGGFKDLGKAYLTTQASNYSSYKLDIMQSTQLTYDSLISILNNLYDIATKGCNPQQIAIGSTNLGKLEATEEGQQAIALAQTKGWTVS